jgi:putative transposase
MPEAGYGSAVGGGSDGSCFKKRKVNLSQVFAGQQVGVRQVDEHTWLVTFMQYDLGYFDDETCRLEPIENPFGPTVLPMSPE